MATARILLYNAILFILISACDSRSLQCFKGTLKSVEKWNQNTADESATRECGFLLVLKDDCTFFEAKADSIDETNKRIKFLQESSSELKFIGFIAEGKLHPRNIIDGINKKFLLDNSVNNAYECQDACNKILHKIFDLDGAPINEMVCPKAPSFTTIVSTTTVLETTKIHPAFTTENFSTTTEIPKTTSADKSSSSKVATKVVKVVRNKAPFTQLSTEATPISSNANATAEDKSEEGSSLFWLYFVIPILIVLIAGGVFGYMGWKNKWFKKEKKKAVKGKPKKVNARNL